MKLSQGMLTDKYIWLKKSDTLPTELTGPVKYMHAASHVTLSPTHDVTSDVS